MGCDDYPLIDGRYQILGDPVAVEWNPGLAQQFPNAEHHGCRQVYHLDRDGEWAAYNPPRCVGYHCPRCGTPVGLTGHRNCDGSPT